MSRKLIINADDYGICPEVNAAIEDLVKAGKLKNVSVLANAKFYENLDLLTTCCLGVHLNVVEGKPLAENVKILLGKDEQFAGLKQILLRFLMSPLAVLKAVEIEWREQIERLLRNGLTLSHADSHQHIHAFPPFWRIAVKLCAEYKIPSVRLPRERNDIQRRRLSAFSLNQCGNVSKIISFNKNLAVNDHFLGFKRAGVYGENEMINDLMNLKKGITELVVHPSVADRTPYQELQGRLEYQALLSANLWRHIEESKIEPITWSECSKDYLKNIN